MKKTVISLSLIALSVLPVSADSVKVPQLKYSGPYPVTVPFQVDSVDVNSKGFEISSILDLPFSLDKLDKSTLTIDSILNPGDGAAIHLVGFKIDNPSYLNGKINVKGADCYRLYVDGKRNDSGDVKLTPATHEIVIKCLTTPLKADTISVSIDTDRPENVVLDYSDTRRYSLPDVLHGERIQSASISPSGKYLFTGYYDVAPGGKTTHAYKVTDVSTGKQIASYGEMMNWMPSTDRLYYTQRYGDDTKLFIVDPLTGEHDGAGYTIPDGRFMISPTEDFLISTVVQKGPGEDADVYEIIHPDDRQPGWRNRSSFLKYGLTSNVSVPLTFGYRDANLCDISSDGSKMLFTVKSSRLEKRPTSLTALYLMDLNTMKVDTLVAGDGFMASAALSPDGSKVVLVGSPEAFDGIGKNVKPGQTPSMYDNQMYVMDIATKDIKPLTRDFNPAIENVEWSRHDDKIYFRGENRDCIDLYRVDPVTGKIEDLGSREEVVNSFSIAVTSPVMVYYGQGASNSDRLYTINLKNMKHSLVDDVSSRRLEGIRLGECEAWDYVTSRGDTICARYILPADFDPAKKYPMIVNYYGGCNPTSRNFESRYPHHVYAAQGYVVLVIIPSGASGFGQEFSARHVNTAGEGVAEDIIEGVKQFTAVHPFVNEKKIGCIGASYGGFMTQYLQTVTDIFAAAISHAGISDHTSYWGEGYWGYSYSEVSMANSYPWSETDLYVKQSPLYNADKVHTPILFLHGDGDTNVPVGESIQMYTALKLLGRETAFVAVNGANHQIVDYHQRQKWQDTIFAWFAKHLKDDNSWWEALYPAKSL